jgi:hypothetical protein
LPGDAVQRLINDVGEIDHDEIRLHAGFDRADLAIELHSAGAAKGRGAHRRDAALELEITYGIVSDAAAMLRH